MATQITIELPEEAFSALKRTPEDFVKEMRLAATVKWYEIGLISQSKAAELAGLSSTYRTARQGDMAHSWDMKQSGLSIDALAIPHES